MQGEISSLRLFSLKHGSIRACSLETSAVGGWGYWLAKKLVFDKLKARLGLSEARLCMTSAAPISRDTLEFFLSLDMPILEIFGMTEISGIRSRCNQHNILGLCLLS